MNNASAAAASCRLTMCCSSWSCQAAAQQAQQHAPGAPPAAAAAAALPWVALAGWRLVTSLWLRLQTLGWRVCWKSRTHTSPGCTGCVQCLQQLASSTARKFLQAGMRLYTACGRFLGCLAGCCQLLRLACMV